MCLNSISSKPPLAVFSASIIAFVLTLMCVSLYFQGHKADILNPDIKDWNSFYSTLSDMDICFHNSTKLSRIHRELPPVLPVISNTTEDANVTFNIYADVQVELDGKDIQDKVFHAVVEAKLLGFKRDPSVLQVTIELAKDVAKNWTACMTFFGPSHLLPDSPQMPPRCAISKEVHPIQVELAQPWLVKDWCKGGKIGGLTVAPQHELSVYLSEGDITLIQMHILYTTCLLCVMMMVLLFYFMCGKRCVPKTKTAQVVFDKIPLQP